MGVYEYVPPTSRFGELAVSGEVVEQFEEKPVFEDGRLVSGGYFMFQRRFFQYLSEDEGCVLEHEPLRRLARDGHLMVYRHGDFWHPMDTYRDYQYLNDLWRSGAAPWKVW